MDSDELRISGVEGCSWGEAAPSPAPWRAMPCCGVGEGTVGEPEAKSAKCDPSSLSVGELATEDEALDASDMRESSLILVWSVTLLRTSMACSAAWSAS